MAEYIFNLIDFTNSTFEFDNLPSTHIAKGETEVEAALDFLTTHCGITVSKTISDLDALNFYLQPSLISLELKKASEK